MKVWLGLGLGTLAACALAQTTVTTSGTTSSSAVPVFNGTATVTNSPIYATSTGLVGIGTSSPQAGLDVQFSATSTTQTGLRVFNTVGTAYSGDFPQNHFQSSFTGSGTQGYLYGTANSVILDASSTGSITNAYAALYRVYNNSASESIANAWALYIVSPTFLSGGTIAKAIGMEILPQSGSGLTGVTAGYGILQDGSNDINSFAGKMGIGTTSPGYQLDVTGVIHSTGGVVFPDGNVQTVAFSTTLCGGDYAESVDVTRDRTSFEPGDVLVIDSENPGKFLKSAEPYSTLVSGVFSTKPGLVGRRQTTPKSPDEVPMAVVGIVPTKVTAENGAIRPGDLLVTSSTAGFAMKGTDRNRLQGAVIGKALGPLDSGSGVIEVLVTMQ